MTLNLAIIRNVTITSNVNSEAPVNLSEANGGRVKHFRGVLGSPQIVSNSPEKRLEMTLVPGG